MVPSIWHERLVYKGHTKVLFHGRTPTTTLSRRRGSRKLRIQVRFRSRSCARGPVEASLNPHGSLGLPALLVLFPPAASGVYVPPPTYPAADRLSAARWVS